MIPHIKPEFNWVDKSSLLIPRDGPAGYQRSIGAHMGGIAEGSKANFNRIQRQFSWTLFGALLCVRRPNGDLVVFDGGHRLDAVRHMDSIAAVPCLIYRIDDVRQEAEVFRAINKWRTGLMLADDHRAAVIQADPIALNIEKSIIKLGRTVSRFSGPKQISCIRSLRKIFAADADRAAGVVGFFGELAAGHVLDRYLIDGMFHIDTRLQQKRTPESILTTYREAILNTGISVISDSMKRERIITDKGGTNHASPEVSARGIVKAVNEFAGTDIKLDGRGRPRKASPVARAVEIKSQVGLHKVKGGAHAAA